MTVNDFSCVASAYDGLVSARTSCYIDFYLIAITVLDRPR